MRIRIAREADIPEMNRVRMSVRENRLSDLTLVHPGAYLAMLEDHGRGWVAEVDERIVGFAIADLSRSNVWALFVEPGFEGRAIGRRLHEIMLDWFFESGVERAWLSTEPGTRAERFYERAGWRRAGREANGETRFEMSRAEWVVRPRPTAG